MGLFDTKGVFDKFGKVTQKAAQFNQNFNQQPEDKQGHTMYETFNPSFGIGRKFTFTEGSLIIGGTEYPYSSLTTIEQKHAPTNFSDGVAQTTVDGKVLTLGYNIGQGERFIKIMTYANEQIDKAHGTKRDYRFLLSGGTDTKMEVYDDYLILYKTSGGYRSLLSNAFAGGTNGNIIRFSDIDVELVVDNGGTVFRISNKDGSVDIPICEENKSNAQEILNYINQVKNEQANAEPEFINEKWEPIGASARTFSLCDKYVEVSAEMDLFNSYRNTFRDLANTYSKAARKEYDGRVKDLMTNLEFFPNIYGKHLNALGKKAIDILISEGIYTITQDLFVDKHFENYHSAFDDFNVTLESIRLTKQKNVQRIANITSFVPNLVGGGFGTKGAIKGIAKAEAFNVVRDGLEAGMLNSANQVSQPQQAELFGRIKPDVLFDHVYNDYWLVFLTIVSEFISNGINVWLPSEKATNTAQNVFRNLSNPNFPEERKLDMFINILTTFPYKREYFKFMVDNYGDNEQTKAIRDYFGYFNLDDPRLGK